MPPRLCVCLLHNDVFNHRNGGIPPNLPSNRHIDRSAARRRAKQAHAIVGHGETCPRRAVGLNLVNNALVVENALQRFKRSRNIAVLGTNRQNMLRPFWIELGFLTKLIGVYELPPVSSRRAERPAIDRRLLFRSCFRGRLGLGFWSVFRFLSSRSSIVGIVFRCIICAATATSQRTRERRKQCHRRHAKHGL